MADNVIFKNNVLLNNIQKQEGLDNLVGENTNKEL